jgi:tRNA(adenine34) deaminase
MNDEFFMEMCLREASAAAESGEVPVGAVIVSLEGKVLAVTHNGTIERNSAVAHAEILAIEKASMTQGNYRLTGCTLYVSKEPCTMCAGAIIEARLKRVVFGCFDEKRGALGSVFSVNDLRLNHKVEVEGGVLAEKCLAMLREFFQMRRGTEVVITGPTRNRLYA